MKKHSFLFDRIFDDLSRLSSPSAFAVGGKEFGASLLIPTTGQAMNGEFRATKTKIMAGIEVAAITTTVLLATLDQRGRFLGGSRALDRQPRVERRGRP